MTHLPAPIPTLRAFLITLTLLSAGASAQTAMPGMHHSAAPGAEAAGPGSQGAELSALRKLRGRAFDRAFLSMMVPHHQMAVAMARAALPVSRDAKVKAWTTAVIRDQTREIVQMNTLLGTFGGADPAMSAGMSGMSSAPKAAGNPDVAFVQGMLPHHAAAVDMANLALQQGQDARVLKLARDIVTAQASEMYSYRTWLRARGL
ncbi:DUF305 domain-containing protein [Deinococcus sp.]|uniref:DUF305 domain-containing protein n=1 Tax=Deinococcus sp. TaxID=47478 RepID=UPI0025BF4CA1|nr:DUF305 domain-containing protein [Deinococcus sp.]